MPATASEEPTPSFDAPVATSRITPTIGAALQTVRVFAYGVARNRLMQGAKRLGVPAVVVRDVAEADAWDLRSYYRNCQHRGRS
jgi:hypothetical protein